jgi:hypothetical protein
MHSEIYFISLFFFFKLCISLKLFSLQKEFLGRKNLEKDASLHQSQVTTVPHQSSPFRTHSMQLGACILSVPSTTF